MQPIDLGDFEVAVTAQHPTRQAALFHAVREKITSGLWQTGCRLPATRKMAEAISMSRNTVIAAYEQLSAEGYIESRQSSGFYVSINLPEHYLQAPSPTPSVLTTTSSTSDTNRPFAPGIPDLSAFPLAQWQKCLMHHLSRPVLLGERTLQGEPQLRSAISQYLASSRSVYCDATRVVITSGAQQALTIAVLATLAKDQTLLMENPGYTQMRKVLELTNHTYQPLEVIPHEGIPIDQVLSSNAQAVYLTPSNQYPMGTSLNTEQRLALIEWAASREGWIIEDDYDSEFQFAHRPYTSLQGLAAQAKLDKHVIYIGSFSKVMFNGLRLGYMVVPTNMLNKCLAIKDAITGDTPAHTQAALADFIQEGHLLRHIRKMRRLYQQKFERMVEAIATHIGDEWQIISQAAGLHITVIWSSAVTEDALTDAAAKKAIYLRTLGYYRFAENAPIHTQSGAAQQGLVLGYGNVQLDAIEPLIQTLAACYFALCEDSASCKKA